MMAIPDIGRNDAVEPPAPIGAGPIVVTPMPVIETPPAPAPAAQAPAPPPPPAPEPAPLVKAPLAVSVMVPVLPSAMPPVGAAEGAEAPAKEAAGSILAIDIGGTKVKVLLKGQTEPRKAPSGKEFTPAKLVEVIRELAADWEYDVISIGYPGLVGSHGPRSEPGNLGSGWVGFDFQAAFGKPVKFINDAVMQALGSYDGGRMLFLGLGTGLGSALIAGQVIVPLELGRLRFDDERTLGQVLGRRGLEEIGKNDWRKAVNSTVSSLMHAFLADYVVIGGGNAKVVKDLPAGARRGNNLTAFRGGFRLWGVEDTWVMAAPGGETPQPTAQEALRLV